METIIFNKYEILEKIGVGNFGYTFLAKNIKTNERVAVKVEPSNIPFSLLKNEARMYTELKSISCVPNMRWYGSDDNFYYIVIDLLGPDLNSYVHSTKLPTIRINNIMRQLISLLQSIHNFKILHRDIKPGNILLDLHEGVDRLYLIDFGFATKNCIENKERQNNSLIGSLNYASVNVHMRHWMSYRDDLESLGYVYYFIQSNGYLPWNDESDEQKLMHRKLNFEWPNRCLKGYMDYIRTLDFNTVPNYANMINMFSTERI